MSNLNDQTGATRLCKSLAFFPNFGPYFIRADNVECVVCGRTTTKAELASRRERSRVVILKWHGFPHDTTDAAGR